MKPSWLRARRWYLPGMRRRAMRALVSGAIAVGSLATASAATGADDLGPPNVDAEFGGGRVLPIRASSPAPNIAMGVTRIGEGGYRVFAFDDFRAPADNDLQLVAMAETGGGDRVAVLQFLHPILRRTQFLGVPVEHTIAVDLTSPEGKEVSLELRPDGTTGLVVDGNDRSEPPFAIPVGTDALF